eukprot:scaffold143803_cov148-Phaeocystis_antarctica.AAC.1
MESMIYTCVGNEGSVDLQVPSRNGPGNGQICSSRRDRGRTAADRTASGSLRTTTTQRARESTPRPL